MFEQDFGSAYFMLNSMIAESKKDILQYIQGRYLTVACATSGSNIALNGSQTIDGYTPVDGDYVLVKDQTDTTQNGIYVYSSTGTWNRFTYDLTKMPVGSAVVVQNGGINGGNIFVGKASNPTTFTFGQSITYTSYQAASADGSYQVGGNLPRQTVVSGPVDSNGYANLLAADTGNAGSSVKLKGGSLFNFANGFSSKGPVDYLGYVPSDISAAWNVPVNNNDVMLAVQRDPSSGSLSYVTAYAPPQYGYKFQTANKHALLHFEGANGSNVFTDDYGNAWQTNGSPQITTANSKFGSSALKFTTATDAIYSTAFTTTPDKWTWETWVFATSIPSGTAGGIPIGGFRTGAFSAAATTNNMFIGISASGVANAGGKLGVWLGSGSTSWDINDGSTSATPFVFPVGQWVHIAVTFDAQAYRVFANGVLVQTIYSGKTIGAFAEAYFGTYDGGTSWSSINGSAYYDEFRFFPACRYVQSFAVPTAAFVPTGDFYNIPLGQMQTITGAGPTFTNVQRVYVGEASVNGASALLHFEGVNGSQVIPDDYGNEWLWNSSAKISTSAYKFGSSSLRLTASTSDFLTNYNLGLNWNNSAWCIEGWFNFPTLPASSSRWNLWAGLFTNYLRLYNNAGVYKLELVLSSTGVSSGSYDIANNVTGSITNWAANTWYHIALTFDGSAYRVFVNGVLDQIINTTTKIYPNFDKFWVGTDGATTFCDAYIDEFRISQQARYTANFTPSTVPFVADESKVNIILNYAYQGKYDSGVFSVTSNGTKYYKSHNLGIDPAFCNIQAMTRQGASFNWINVYQTTTFWNSINSTSAVYGCDISGADRKTALIGFSAVIGSGITAIPPQASGSVYAANSDYTTGDFRVQVSRGF